MEPGERWERMVALMARLRGPQGCPWDRKQTLHSLRPFILEEAYELVDAIEQDEGEAIRKRRGTCSSRCSSFHRSAPRKASSLRTACSRA